MPEFGMPASPIPPASAASRPAAAPVAESATTALYRAALGPVNTARYLAVFERFDAAGRASLVWHPAAALCTLSWMVFRRLWVAALVYALAVAGVTGLVLWRLPQVLAWPAGVQWGALGSLLLLSVALPGLLGHALLHANTRRRMVRAVATARTVREACATLGRQAGSRRRLHAVVLGNALLAAVLVAAWLAWAPARPPTAGPLAGTRTEQAAAPDEPALPAAIRSSALPEPAPVLAAGIPPAAGVGMASDAEPRVVSVTATGAVTAAEPEPEPDAGVVPATPSPAGVSATVLAARPAVAPPVPAGAPAPVAPGDYGINVGLFADEGNARRAHDRLIEAGLPATTQVIASAKGPLTRVRVGPFDQRASADAAARRIRALGLEAVVFRQ